jgi:hypothetical protein
LPLNSFVVLDLPASINIGERNKQLSTLYKQGDHANNQTIEEDIETHPNDPNSAERSQFGRASKSENTLRLEVKQWAAGVQLKVRLFVIQFFIFIWLSATMLTLASSFWLVEGAQRLFWNRGLPCSCCARPCKAFFFQGGSFLGDEYLRGLVEEGNPVRKFALWTAGSKKTNKKKGSTVPATQSSGNTTDSQTPEQKKKKLALEAFENRDVCQGMS